jgi:nitrite reductase/ring-hydroxylating ferredoxin subunit
MINRRAFIGASAVFVAACAAPNENAAEISGPVEIGKLSDIPVGAGRVYEAAGVRVLVTRPRENEIRAFEAKCTHQGGALTAVENGEINCPIHGAKFDADSGEVIQGPAETSLRTFSIEVSEDGDTLLLSN